MTSVNLSQDPIRFCYKGAALNLSMDRQSWPRASDEYLCCWAALEQIGAGIHGDAWKATDLAARIPATPPDFARANPPAGRVKPTDEEYWSKETSRWDRNRESYIRLKNTILWLGEELRNGKIHGASLKSGQMVAIPASYWFGVGAEDAACQTGRIGNNFLFIPRADLLARLTVLREPEIAIPSTADGLHLSPYLKLMLAVVERLGITQDNQPKKIEVEYAIAELAPRFGLQCNPYAGNERQQAEKKAWRPDKGMASLGETTHGVMATLIREISNQNPTGG